MTELTEIAYGLHEDDYRQLDADLDALAIAGDQHKEYITDHNRLMRQLEKMAADPEVTKEQLAAAIQNIIDAGLPDIDDVLDRIDKVRDSVEYGIVDIQSEVENLQNLNEREEATEKLERMIQDLPDVIIAEYIDILEAKYGPSSPALPLLRLMADEK